MIQDASDRKTIFVSLKFANIPISPMKSSKEWGSDEKHSASSIYSPAEDNESLSMAYVGFKAPPIGIR